MVYLFIVAYIMLNMIDKILGMFVFIKNIACLHLCARGLPGIDLDSVSVSKTSACTAGTYG